MHDASATATRDLLRSAGVEAHVRVGDFFTSDPTGCYDTVIGTPPYVRYQEFPTEPRAQSREAALRAGVPMSGLASSWAAFTVHAALFLRKGGRLGLVLPAELMTANYAAPVRPFLLERFASVDLVLFEERVFSDVLEEVVLLLAEGYDEANIDRKITAANGQPTDLVEATGSRLLDLNGIGHRGPRDCYAVSVTSPSSPPRLTSPADRRRGPLWH